MVGLNGVVDPNSEHSTVAPSGATPLSAEDGTSTAGVRTPPLTLPSVSRANVTGWVLEKTNGRGDGGAWPVARHLANAVKAAWTTGCCGPWLMSVLQPRT